MKPFTVHDSESAPEDAKPLLRKSKDEFGMIPNLHGVMAEAPTVLEGYQQLHALATKTSFSKEELTVVWQSINVEHACHYCVPAHTAIAKSMEVSDDISMALRDEKALPDKKLEVLRSTTLALLRNRGKLTDSEQANFYSAGYENQQLMEIVLVMAQKVMSNYINHLADTPVDEPFKKFNWAKS